MIYETREALTNLLNIEDPLSVVLPKNAVEALNIALREALQPGERAVTSGMEHSAVMRPLHFLESRRGCDFRDAAEDRYHPIKTRKRGILFS